MDKKSNKDLKELTEIILDMKKLLKKISKN